MAADVTGDINVTLARFSAGSSPTSATEDIKQRRPAVTARAGKPCPSLTELREPFQKEPSKDDICPDFLIISPSMLCSKGKGLGSDSLEQSLEFADAHQQQSRYCTSI